MESSGLESVSKQWQQVFGGTVTGSALGKQERVQVTRRWVCFLDDL